MTSLLKETNPTFQELDVYGENFVDVGSKYSSAVQDYILNNDKSCYFTVRKVRINPTAIPDAVEAILTKCIGYRNKLDNRC